MSSSLAELQSLIAQSYDEIHHPRRDYQDLQVALVSPHRSLKSSSCLVVEFHHNGTKYQILFSNGTTALVQVINARNSTQESQKLLSISHSQDSVEIYSDLSSQLEVIQSLEPVHDLRRLLYFIFIIYFQKNRLPCPQGEIENQAVRTRPKALSVEKRLCLPYEVRRKLTFEKKLALSDQPANSEGIHKTILGTELERRLVVPFLESSRKEILITRREIARDFLQNLILQKLQKRIPPIKNEINRAESAQGPIPLPCQENFEAPKPVLKMKPREKRNPVVEKLKNHIEKSEKKRLKAPLKKAKISKKSEALRSYSLIPSLSDLSFERNFNRIISECVGKLNSSICAKSLNLLKIWTEPSYKVVCIPHIEAPKINLLKQLTPLQSQALVVSNNRKLKFTTPGLPISSILKAHYFNYQQNSLSGLFTPKLQTFNVELKPRRQLALPYQKVLALPYSKTLALPYSRTLALTYNQTLALPYSKTLALTYPKIYALPYFQRLAIAYQEPEAIPLPNKETVIALPDKPRLAITYQPLLALSYTKVLALPYETPNMEILDIYKFLEPKWLDYLGMNSLPVGTLKFYTDSSCQEQTASVELSFSSSDDSENLLDDEVSLQESFIEEANQENLPLLEAQSTSELSEIDLDLQASTQFLEKVEEEDAYGFEVIPDDEIVIIEEDVVCVNDAGY